MRCPDTNRSLSTNSEGVPLRRQGRHKAFRGVQNGESPFTTRATSPQAVKQCPSEGLPESDLLQTDSEQAPSLLEFVSGVAAGHPFRRTMFAVRHGVENQFHSAGDSNLVEDAQQIFLDGVFA